MGLVTTSLM